MSLFVSQYVRLLTIHKVAMLEDLYELMFHIVVLPDSGALADINGFVYLNLRCSGSKHNLHKKPAMEPLSVPICRYTLKFITPHFTFIGPLNPSLQSQIQIQINNKIHRPPFHLHCPTRSKFAATNTYTTTKTKTKTNTHYNLSLPTLPSMPSLA